MGYPLFYGNILNNIGMNRNNQTNELQNMEQNKINNEIIKKIETEIDKWRKNGFEPAQINTRNLSIGIEDIDKAVQSIERTGIPAKNHLDFLRFIKASGLGCMFWHYHLIPNQNGTLCRERDLRNGESTTKGLVKTIRMMIKSDTQKLVDPEYRDIADFEQYSWNDLMEKISKMAERNEAADTNNKKQK